MEFDFTGWWEPLEGKGEGFLFYDSKVEGELAVLFFTYMDGHPAWFIGIGEYITPEKAFFNMYRTWGREMGDGQDAKESMWGTLQVFGLSNGDIEVTVEPDRETARIYDAHRFEGVVSGRKSVAEPKPEPVRSAPVYEISKSPGGPRIDAEAMKATRSRFPSEWYVKVLSGQLAIDGINVSTQSGNPVPHNARITGVRVGDVLLAGDNPTRIRINADSGWRQDSGVYDRVTLTVRAKEVGTLISATVDVEVA